MVRIYFVIICLFYIPHIFAQEVIYVNECEEEEVGFQPPEEYPVYRLGKYESNDIFSFLTMLSDSIKCPFENCDSISGRVIIRFFVQKTGEISDVKIVRGINKDIDKEAVRVFNLLRCVKPAITRKKPIQYKEVIPIKINFQEHTQIKRK
jgi:hypothetical protein